MWGGWGLRAEGGRRLLGWGRNVRRRVTKGMEEGGNIVCKS